MLEIRLSDGTYERKWEDREEPVREVQQHENSPKQHHFYEGFKAWTSPHLQKTPPVSLSEYKLAIDIKPVESVLAFSRSGRAQEQSPLQPLPCAGIVRDSM